MVYFGNFIRYQMSGKEEIVSVSGIYIKVDKGNQKYKQKERIKIK